MKGEKYMTQVNSYLAEFSRKSNLSPVYKHKVIKSLRQEIEAKIEGGDTEKDVYLLLDR